MATKEQLERALRNADKAGDSVAARRLASAIRNSEFDQQAAPPSGEMVAGNFPDVPGADQDAAVAEGYRQSAAARAAQPEPTIADKIAAGADAGLTMFTGGTTGMLGQVAGTLQQGGRELLSGQFGTPEAANRIEQRAADVAASATHSPRSPLAGKYLQNISEAVAPLAGLAGLSGQMNAVSNAARMGAPVARQMAGESVNAFRKAPEDSSVRSMGAAQAQTPQIRREMAAQMPVDPQLTKGQATRDFEQLRFEGETAKGELGAPLRERFAKQHQAIMQSFDDFIDQSGAVGSDKTDTGNSVVNALNARSRRDKAEIKKAYDEARGSKEAQAVVDPSSKVSIDGAETSLIDYLNSKPSGLRTTGIIDDAKKFAIRLGAAEAAEDGSLIAKPTTLSNMEDLRREIGQSTGLEPVDVRESSILKNIIDRQTESVAGPVYKRARNLRTKYGKNYQNRAIISSLIENKKGSDDRRVAVEDVFDQVAFRASREDARHLRKMLQNEGESGQQAWKEVQGQALKYIRDEATKNNVRDADGNEMISSAGLNKAINRLDEDGKLELIYGKNGAQKLRDINDLSRDLFTAPAGAINNSNTASVILSAIDMMTSATAGLPLPIGLTTRAAIKNIKDRKIKKRIQEALALPSEDKK